MIRALTRARAVTLIVVLATLAFSLPAAAREPTTTVTFVIPGAVDPCSGATHTVTIVADLFVHQTNGATVVLQDRTITTDPTGYVGRGTATVVTNGPIIVMSLRDMQLSSSGARVRVHGTIILDASTTPPTPRVMNVEFACVRP